MKKRVFDKNAYPKVIDTQFKQLLSTVEEEETLSFTIEDFFELYEQLFYQIPREGDTNSHQYIIEKEAEYLGIIISQDDIQALLDEITVLRQQIVDTQNTLDELSKTIQ